MALLSRTDAPSETRPARTITSMPPHRRVRWAGFALALLVLVSGLAFGRPATTGAPNPADNIAADHP